MNKVENLIAYIDGETIYFVTASAGQDFERLTTRMQRVGQAKVVFHEGEVVKSMLYFNHNPDAYNRFVNFIDDK